MSDADRAAEIADRQTRIAQLLRDTGTDAALLLDPANFGWLTAGTAADPVADPAEPPALYVIEKQRWVLCANVDTQRLFDEELDDLGFQVKEWPWHLGRQTLLHGLVNGRKLASDQLLNGCINVVEPLRQMRRARSAWDQERLRELGRTMAHALEATCRNVSRGDTEQEVAGHISHRLIHRGVTPVSVHVAADGRLRRYRRVACTSTKIEQNCVVQATGRRQGLHVTASRTVSFGPPDEAFRQEYDLACRLSSVQVVESVAGATLAAVFKMWRRLLGPQQREHEWRQAPVGWLTGYAPVELPFTPDTSEPLQPGWAIVWAASVAAGLVTDTFLVTPAGLECLTTVEAWPVRRFKIGEQLIERPEILLQN